jgi:hypothetical protein
MYKLYRSKRNKRLHRLINVGGSIHNHCIALHKRYYRMYKKHLSLYQLKAHITKLKQLPKYVWWTQLGSQAIQDIVIRIDKGSAITGDHGGANLTQGGEESRPCPHRDGNHYPCLTSSRPGCLRKQRDLGGVEDDELRQGSTARIDAV